MFLLINNYDNFIFMKKSKRERVEEFLIEFSDILSVLPFERRLGFTRGKVYKFLKNKRKLSTSEIRTIDSCIQKVIDKYLE